MRRVLVTGAAGGMGAAIVADLARDRRRLPRPAGDQPHRPGRAHPAVPAAASRRAGERGVHRVRRLYEAGPGKCRLSGDQACAQGVRGRAADRRGSQRCAGCDRGAGPDSDCDVREVAGGGRPSVRAGPAHHPRVGGACSPVRTRRLRRRPSHRCRRQAPSGTRLRPPTSITQRGCPARPPSPRYVRVFVHGVQPAGPDLGPARPA
jgi:hypothetical protein